MTAEQLEELLGKVTQGEWEWRWDIAHREDKTNLDYAYAFLSNGEKDKYGLDTRIAGSSEWLEIGHHDATLIALAPSLARRVLAAEKLVEELEVQYAVFGLTPKCIDALTAYREASK